MARKKKNTRNRYRSRYQLGGLQGVPTNLNVSDTTLSPIQRGQQSGLLSNPQNVMQQFQAANARQGAGEQHVLQRANQMKLREQKLMQMRSAAEGPQGPQMFQGGGMYADNTVQAAGQGRGTSTSNIVFQEKDPKLQAQRLAAFEAERERLAQAGQEASSEIKQQQQLDEAAVQQAAISSGQGFESGLSAAKTGFDVAKEAGAFKSILARQAAKRAAAQTAGAGVKGAAGTLSSIPVGVAAPTTTYGAGLIGPAQAPIAGAVGSTAAKTAGQFAGAGVGTGVGKFLTSGAGIGTVATLAGEGIKALSADDDPTKYNPGEIGGDILSSAGTGASIGSFLGPVGTGVGAVVGGIYGGVKGLVARNKARTKKKELEVKRERQIEDINVKTRERLGTQMSLVRAGQLKGKTYSGYDVGRNVAAQLGGMRMGMPRYGYAA